MITVIESPTTISMADKAKLVLQTTDNIIEAGVEAEYTIEFISGVPALNSTISFVYDVHILVFTVVASASDPFEITRGDGTLVGNVNSFIPNLINSFQNNFLLNRDFVFSVIFSDIIVKAREIGAQYNPSITFSSSGISLPIQNGRDNIIADNYSIRVVFNAFVKGGEAVRFDFQKPLINALATFVFEAALMASISNPVKPVLNHLPTDTSTALVRYNYRYTDALGVPPLPGKLSTLVSRFAIAGGNAKGIDANTYFSTGKNFASYIPQSLCLKSEFYLVLPYYHLVNENWLLSIQITFLDGSIETFTEIDFNTSPEIQDMYLVPISPELILAEYGYDISEIFKIEARIVSSFAAVLTKTISIIVDHSGFVERNVFRFKNSFGLYEILNTYGLSIRTENFTGTNAEDENGSLKFNSRRSKILTINTGFLSREMSRYFIDFLLSEHVEMFDGSDWVPVSVSPFNFTVESLRMGNVNNPEIQVNFAKSKYYG